MGSGHADGSAGTEASLGQLYSVAKGTARGWHNFTRQQGGMRPCAFVLVYSWLKLLAHGCGCRLPQVPRTQPRKSPPLLTAPPRSRKVAGDTILGEPRICQGGKDPLKRPPLFVIAAVPTDCHSAHTRRTGPQDVSLEGRERERKGWWGAQVLPARCINQVTLRPKLKLQRLSAPPPGTWGPKGTEASSGYLLEAAAALWPMVCSRWGSRMTWVLSLHCLGPRPDLVPNELSSLGETPTHLLQRYRTVTQNRRSSSLLYQPKQQPREK